MSQPPVVLDPTDRRFSSRPAPARVAVTHSPRAERVRLAVALFAFTAVAALLTWRAFVHGEPWMFMDFSTNLYYPARALLDGIDPYDTAALIARYPIQPPIPPYAPLSLVLHAPLALVPVTLAAPVFFAGNVLLTLLLAYLSLRAARLPANAAAVFGVGSLLLASRPGTMNAMLGQPTLMIVIAAYVALLYARTRPRLAMLGVAIATVKPQFGVPLALLMAADGAVGVVAGGLAASALVAIAVALVIVGGDVAAALTLLASLPRHAASLDAATVTWWSRLDVPYLASQALGAAAGRTATLVLAVGVLGFGIWGLRRARGGPSERAIAITCLTILLCLYHQAYDALLLTLPILALAARLYRRPPAEKTLALLLLLMAIPAVNYLATFSAIDRLGITGDWWHAVTALNGIALAAALIIWTSLPPTHADRRGASSRPCRAGIP